MPASRCSDLDKWSGGLGGRGAEVESCVADWMWLSTVEAEPKEERVESTEFCLEAGGLE